jgi:hypothetical protein
MTPQMEKSEEINELAKALNKVQAILQPAAADSENPYFKSMYAGLLSVWNAARPALAANGLSIAQVASLIPVSPGGNQVCLETILMHESGQWLKGCLPLQSLKQDPQAQGSALTYARRYSLSAILGLCTEEDDDGNKASDIKAQPEAAKEEAKTKPHWCQEHKIAYFKKGKMRGYGHPIMIDAKETGGWCHEGGARKPGPKTKAQEYYEPAFKNLGDFYQHCLDGLGLSKTRVDAELKGAVEISQGQNLILAWQQLWAVYSPHKKVAAQASEAQ